MTTENKPSFKTETREFVKGVGLLFRLAFDPRMDPYAEAIKRGGFPLPFRLGKPEALAGKLRDALNVIRRKQ